MALSDNRCPSGLDRDPHFSDIDSQKGAAIFPGENAAGFDCFPAPAIERRRSGWPPRLRTSLRYRTARGHWPRACGPAGRQVFAAAPVLALLKSPSPHPHAQNRLRIGECNAFDFRAVFELAQQFLPFQSGRTGLPIDAGDGCLIDHHEGGQARADRDRKVRRGDLLQVELDHHVLGDLPAFGGAILQAVETLLHVGNPAFEPCGQGLVGEGRADDGGDDLVQVGETLDRIGEGLLVDVGVFRPGCGRGWRGRWMAANVS